MKKFIFLLSVITLISCKNTNYEISGVLPNVDDSSFVYIKTLNLDNTYQILDSSLVINNQYKISGNWKKEPINAILIHKHIPFTPKFILENGKINLNVENIDKQEYSISGTVNNDTLDALNYKTLESRNKIISQIITANNTDLSIIEKNKLYNSAFEIQNSIDLVTLNTIKTNINEPIGALLLEDIILRKALPVNVTKEIINLMNEKNIYKSRLKTYTDGNIISLDLGKKLDLNEFDHSENPDKTDFNSILENENIVYFWNNSSPKYKETLEILNKINKVGLTKVDIFTVYLGTNEKNWELALGENVSNFNNIYSNINHNKAAKNFDLKLLPKLFIVNKDGIVKNVLTNNNSLTEFLINNYLKSDQK